MNHVEIFTILFKIVLPAMVMLFVFYKIVYPLLKLIVAIIELVLIVIKDALMWTHKMFTGQKKNAEEKIAEGNLEPAHN